MIDDFMQIKFGVAYYPEHWPENRWEEDIALMQAAGINVVRMAEFAWSSLEPEENNYQLDWLQRAIDLLSENGIYTVLGTPTAAPPAWLVSNYPGTLAVDESGKKVRFGNRCHYCVNSGDFHRLSQKIVKVMGEKFGKHPDVIGWQIDNEFTRICYCDRCREEFQGFLKKQYADLDSLNFHWSTRYWSQTYSDWSQIPLPVGYHNPGLLLNFKYFNTFSYRRFLQLQIEALKPHLHKDSFVTHNFINLSDCFDHYEMATELDLVGLDMYIGSGNHNRFLSGANFDLARGLKQKNFWLMETQPGSVNWADINNSLDAGEARAIAWQAVAHGADAILYWQWRSAPGGQEQYHGSFLDQAGLPRPFYEEAAQLGQEINRNSEYLATTRPSSQVALLFDYPSRWSIGFQPHHEGFDYLDHFMAYYTALVAQNIPVDIISADSPIHAYRLVIAPGLIVLNEARTERYKEFVKRGGALVFTARCGMKDEHNALHPERQPAMISDLFGVAVEEYYALHKDISVNGSWFQGITRKWAERLVRLDEIGTAEIATYGRATGWLDGKTAATVRTHGSGLAYYIGAYLDVPALTEMFSRILELRQIRPLMSTPTGVEVYRRTSPDGLQIGFLINHTLRDQQITFPFPVYDYLTSTRIENTTKLEPYGVIIFTRSE